MDGDSLLSTEESETQIGSKVLALRDALCQRTPVSPRNFFDCQASSPTLTKPNTEIALMDVKEDRMVQLVTFLNIYRRLFLESGWICFHFAPESSNFSV